jgi:EAL domain-containing protein (putative c-di-GMP-specific phosphodiesterase class I)
MFVQDFPQRRHHDVGGIESVSELKALRRMGCDMGQGFLFAKPMPRDKLLALLVDYATSQ